jgi:hypothetical protein
MMTSEIAIEIKTSPIQRIRAKTAMIFLSVRSPQKVTLKATLIIYKGLTPATTTLERSSHSA